MRREDLQAVMPFYVAVETELRVSWMKDKLFTSCSQSSVLDIGLNAATDNAEGEDFA